GQHVGFVAQANEEVFGPRRPMRREPDLDPAATGPANMGLSLAQAWDVELACPVGQAGRRVDEDVVERVSGAPAHRAEPRIGKLVGREPALRTRGLDAGFPPECDWPGPPLVSGLCAGGDPTRRVGKISDCGGEIAQIDAQISAGPVDADRGWS